VSGAEFGVQDPEKISPRRTEFVGERPDKNPARHTEFVEEESDKNSFRGAGFVEQGPGKVYLKGGEFVEEGSGKNSLKSPALCLAELSAAIARRFPSYPLIAGEIISTGTLTAGHLTTSGDIWTAEVEGILLPPLTLRLV
jgi:hypothetical protein